MEVLLPLAIPEHTAPLPRVVHAPRSLLAYSDLSRNPWYGEVLPAIAAKSAVRRLT